MIRQILVALALSVCVWNAAEQLIDRYFPQEAACGTDSECEGVE